MATASVINTSECCICFETFITPKMLPCGHTFCLDCIKRLISDKTETFPCPTCQRDVKIPEGGAEDFTTNYIAIDNQPTIQPEPPSTTQPKCPNHNQREVDYYCNNCNVGLCFKCILGQHKEHETLDIECDETRNEAIEKLQRSQKIIQNNITNLQKTRSTLLESFEQVKSLCEDACAEVTAKTEKIVSDLRKSCQKIIKDIGQNLDENRIKVEDREKEITSEINLLESNIESIISPSTETTLNILLTLPRLKEIEQLGECRTDYNLSLWYLQWEGKDFSLDIDHLGSVISKPFYIPGSYQFLFNVSDIEEDDTKYYSENKFRYNNLAWSCSVRRLGSVRRAGSVGGFGSDLDIDIILLEDENPELDNCMIDGKIRLLNFDDKSAILTSRRFKSRRLERGSWLRFKQESGIFCFLLRQKITWSELTNKDNSYLNSKGQFVIQFDLTQIEEIKFLR